MLFKFGNWFELDVALSALFMSFIGYAVHVQRSLGTVKRFDLYQGEGGGVYLEVLGLMFVFSKEGV